jgi:hypothetical protein
MIYIAGDTHGSLDIGKFNTKHFPQQRTMTKKDCVVIAGDFGLIWANSKQERYLLNWLETRNFTTLFVDGNHENFDLLNNYPVSEWNGGKVHQISDSIYHLMRGQVFVIDGQKIFTFGGAMSIDKEYRKEFTSWWKQEIPSEEEFQEGMKNLEKHNYTVDFVITHTAPIVMIRRFGFIDDEKITDPTSIMLNKFANQITFKHWFFGHFHIDKNLGRFSVLYDKIIEMEEDIIAPKDPEPRDWKIEKYISKCKAATPNEPPPSYEDVGIIVDKWDSMGRHITYPPAGTAWNEIEWEREYNRKKIFEKLAERNIHHETLDPKEYFIACANISGKNCPKRDNCQCWKLHEYIVEHNIMGQTCALNNPETCDNFRPYKED